MTLTSFNDDPAAIIIDDEKIEEITDPYDPFVPNDLLEYWEKQAARKQREQLERETQEALLRQKSIRKQLEEERLELQRTGNYSTLLEREKQQQNQPQQSMNNTGGGGVGISTTQTVRGRGRGRGVSNLPAWLIKKQRREGIGGGATTNNENT